MSCYEYYTRLEYTKGTIPFVYSQEFFLCFVCFLADNYYLCNANAKNLLI